MDFCSVSRYSHLTGGFWYRKSLSPRLGAVALGCKKLCPVFVPTSQVWELSQHSLLSLSPHILWNVVFTSSRSLPGDKSVSRERSANLHPQMKLRRWRHFRDFPLTRASAKSKNTCLCPPESHATAHDHRGTLVIYNEKVTATQARYQDTVLLRKTIYRTRVNLESGLVDEESVYGISRMFNRIQLSWLILLLHSMAHLVDWYFQP